MPDERRRFIAVVVGPVPEEYARDRKSPRTARNQLGYGRPLRRVRQ
jgi:hypothetical protein